MADTQALTAVLQAIPWFQQLSNEHFKELAALTHIVSVEPDVELFREGDTEDYLYIVISGRVALDIVAPVRGRITFYTVEPTDAFGWSAVTPVVRQRLASARAVLPSQLAAIDAAGLRQLCDEDHSIGYEVMRRMANIAASRLMVTRLQLLDLFDSPEREDAHASH